MPDISQITAVNGTTYNLKDAQARQDIADIREAISGGVVFIGETSTELTDGATTNPITINGSSVTAVQGNLVVYSNKEFVFDGTHWIEMGDLTALGDLAWKDSASGNFTPAGTVSQPTFTGTPGEVTVVVQTASSSSGDNIIEIPYTFASQTFTGSSTTFTGSFTPEGDVQLTTQNRTVAVSQASSGDTTYTPEGSVTAPTISVSTAGTTTTVNSITAVGSLPSLTMSVANENLTFAFDQGALPTKGTDTTVKTGDASYTATTPAFTGTGVRLVTAVIPLTTAANFIGTSGSLSVSGTPNGSVSRAQVETSIPKAILGTFTPSGTVSQPTFTGTQGTVTVT